MIKYGLGQVFPILIFVLVFSVETVAQDWEGEGEIETGQVIIEKSREIILPSASRSFNKIPPVPAVQAGSGKTEFSFTPVPLNLNNLDLQARALKMKDEPLEKLYKGYAKAGFGNYLTPYLEGYWYNKREKRYSTGIHLKHLSSRNGPVDKNNSGNGETGVDVAGKIFRGPLTLEADAGYRNSIWHFYGYPEGTITGPEEIRQKFNRFDVSGRMNYQGLENKPSYDAGVHYGFINDIFSRSESVLDGTFSLNFPVQDNLSFGLEGDALFSVYSDSSSLNRNIFRIIPSVNYQYQPLTAEAGLKTVFQNDTLSSRKSTLVYPFVNLTYTISDQFSGYLNLDGDLDRVLLKDVIQENPYIGLKVPLIHTNRKFHLDWGIKGKAGELLFFKAGFAYSILKDYHFYMNASDPSRFTLMYDSASTNRTNIYGEAGISRPNHYFLSLRGDYFKYKTSAGFPPWHKPSYVIRIDGNYNINRKIIVSSGLNFIGGITAFDQLNVTDHEVELGTVNDINFKIDYKLSDRFSVWLDFQNILGNNYELYWRYPVRGFQFMAGLSVNF